MMAKRTAIVALALALAGCAGGLLPPPPPPADLYRLSSAETVPASGPPIAAQILIGRFSAPGAIDTVRIALSPSPTRLEYFAKAEWPDRAPVMVQILLLETLERSGRFSRVAQRSLVLHGDYVVLGALRHFEADYGATAAPQVRVALDLQLVRTADGMILAERRFTAAAPAGRNTVAAVVEAFDVATHRALHDVPAWLAQSLPHAGAKRP